MSKYVKWAGIAVSVPVVLIIVLSLLFYFPPFQRWAVGKVTAYASEEMNMQISVGHVRLAFPLDLSLRDVKVLQPNDSLKNVTDTVADIGEVVVDVQLMPLLSKQVMIDQFEFNNMKVNTMGFIPSAHIKGTIGHLDLKAHGIDLTQELVTVNHAALENAVLSIALSDTVPPDTAPSENFWKINMAQLKVKNTDFTLRMPGDTMSVNMYMGSAEAQKTYLDLHKSHYSVAHLDLDQGRVRYDKNFEPMVEGLDFNHLALDGMRLKADSIFYGDSKLNIKIAESKFMEKSGLRVDSMRGTFAMDSTRLWLPGLRLKTVDGTQVALDFDMDMNAFADSVPGKFNVDLKGQVAKSDLMLFAGQSLPRDMVRRWPNKPLVAVGQVRGNLQRMHIKDVNVSMGGAFKVYADGFAENVTDTKRVKADVKVKANAYDISFVEAMLDKETRKTIRIPKGITIDGNVKANGTRYASKFRATQGGGLLVGDVDFDANRMAYTAKLTARALPVQNFVKGMQLHPFTGYVEANGVGTDFMSPHTRLNATAKIEKFQYQEYKLDNVDAKATLRNGHILAYVDSRNPLVYGRFNVDGTTHGKTLQASLSGTFDKIDFYALHLTEKPLVAAMTTNLSMASDLKQKHQIRGSVGNIAITTQEGTYRPDDVKMDVFTARDTTFAILETGDFTMNMSARGGYEQLIKRGSMAATEMQNQLKNKYIDQSRLRSRLPNVRVFLVSGKNNMLSRLLKYYGYGFNSVFMDLASSSTSGLNGNMYIDSLVVDSFQLDTIRFNFVSDATNMTYSAQVRNGKKNPNYTFNALLDGAINERGTTVKTRIYDANDSLGIRLGLRAAMEQHGISVHIFGDKPILGYKEFAVNDSNYIFLGDNRRVSANMSLQAADGMGIQIYTNDENTEALQDITVGAHKFDLDDIMAVLPFAPDIKGQLNGDFHLVQTPTEMSLSSSVNIANLVYEGSAMGDIGSEFTYMPRPDEGHYIDGNLTHNGHEVGVLKGTYHSAGKGVIDATLDLNRFPLDMANGFIPDRLFGFRGYAEGTLNVKGSTASPDVNGELYLDSTYVFSEPYGVEMRMANDPVRIQNSRLLFENFEMYASNNSPLTIQGYFDFANTDRMNMNLRMRADNFLLIDSEEKARSDAFGKAYVNYFGTVQGLVDNLKMRGRLEVLGTTDVSYNLKDSPLSSDNRLEGLVEFVNFNDTTEQVITRPPLTGVDVDLSINVDDGARVSAYLNADHSNYINVQGGGDLRMQYNNVDNVRITGRYTIGSGEMKYAVSIIPLKTFTIQEGSYIEFRGDPMNPRLNLTATETTKASVGGSSGDGRVVEFTSGVVVTKSLKDMGLEFTIDAPEDMTIHNQLQAMSTEERGKIAVAMLTTGVYLADGNTNGFSMNSALSAFLNSQINSISNKALRTLDLSVGVDNSISSTGAVHTDYSFKFAKHFWNNRLRVVIGGKFSSGAEEANQNETFFDNVTLEYRLSPTSNKYLNLFYQRDDYDWLEGNVSKYGVGFMWRRKLRSFKDLFRFGKNVERDLPAPADTVKQDTIKK